MAYQINKTDGTIVATVADGQIDQLSTDITLIGKNYSGFGESLNENLVKILENFAGTSRPTKPIRGQLWYDVNELKLKIYSGSEFLPVSSATISTTQPSTLGVGDLWFNSVDKQLYFYDGTTPILLGPSYSATQGLSGLKVASILDTLNQTRVITSLYNNGILLGIFAKDSFTPKSAIDGFTGNIQPGFNSGNLAGLKFNVTSTNSEQLGGAVATTYVRKDASNAINGQLRLTTDTSAGGLVVGSGGEGSLYVESGNLFLSNASTDKNFTLNVRKGITQEDAIVISATSRTMEIYPGFTDSNLEVGGSLTVFGDLTVEGVTTTINTANVTVEDKSITLAKQENIVPTDTNANEGGIILQGASSHVFLWSDIGQSATPSSAGALTDGYNDGLPALASQAWTSSEHINLASGKEFKINGVTVLSGNSLGAGITSIPGVTSFGKQTVVNIGPGLISDPTYLRLQDNRISTLITNQDLELAPNGTGNISLIGSPKITGLLDPTSPQDASTKEYVDDTIETRPIVLSMDLSDGKPNSYIVTNILNNIAPTSEYRDGTLARILCTLLSVSTTTLDLDPLITESTATFSTPTGTAPAVTSVAGALATISAPSVSTTRIIKTFQLILGTWTWVSDDVLPP